MKFQFMCALALMVPALFPGAGHGFSWFPTATLYPESPGCPATTWEGGYLFSSFGRWYGLFQGIPYAEPPVGELRFKPPKEIKEECDNGRNDTTDIVREATARGEMCIQFDILFGGSRRIIGDEDCLYLNIFTPGTFLRNPSDPKEHPSKADTASLSDATLAPVMVFVHGGGFLPSDGEYLMDRDVVLVTLNYRLNMFGFLSTEDPDYPGNLGLLDILAALRWIQKNIHSFGGDPNKVTLFGESGGGAAVSHLMLSPQSKGLFHRVITMSGVSNSVWAVQPNATSNARALAKEVMCTTQDLKSMMSCLKEIPGHDLARAWKPLMDPTLKDSFVWVPRIDAEAEAPVLPSPPLKLMKEGNFLRVPYMNGIMMDEGLAMAYVYLLNADMMQNGLSAQWDTVSEAPYGILKSLFNAGEEDLEIIKRHYYAENGTAFQNAFDLKRGMEDLWFDYPAAEATELVSKFVDTYAYVMDYKSKSSWMRNFLRRIPSLRTKERRSDVIWGTCHGDELPFLFSGPGSPLISEKDYPDDFEMKELFVETFTNFAKYGDPNGAKGGNLLVPWPKYKHGSAGSQIFVYNPTPTLTTEFLPKSSADMWRSVFRRLGRDGY